MQNKKFEKETIEWGEKLELNKRGQDFNDGIVRPI